VAALVRAAATPFPGISAETPYGVLLRKAQRQARRVELSLILELYPAMTDEAKGFALGVIAAKRSRKAASALARLLSRCDELPSRPNLGPLRFNPHNPRLLVPALVDASRCPRAVGPASSALLGYAQHGLLGDHLESVAAVATAAAASALQSVDNPDTSGQRRWAAEFLELLGWTGGPAARATLAAGRDRDNTLLAMSSAVALIRLGLDEPTDALRRIASDPWYRLELYDELERLDRLDVLPAELKTQTAFAEVNLLRWVENLVANTAYDIELIETIEMRHRRAAADLYVFRLTEYAGDDHWVIGVSGPYLRSGPPTLGDLGMTGSRFEREGSAPLPELVRSIIDDAAGARAA
jgi:hypothetical protein